jgi:hypothetical protein
MMVRASLAHAGEGDSRPAQWVLQPWLSRDLLIVRHRQAARCAYDPRPGLLTPKAEAGGIRAALLGPRRRKLPRLE